AGRIWWGTGRRIDSDARGTSCDLVRHPWFPESSAARPGSALHRGHAALRPRADAVAPQPLAEGLDRLWHFSARVGCRNGRRYRPVRTDQRSSLQTNYPGPAAVFGTLPCDLGRGLMRRVIGLAAHEPG